MQDRALDKGSESMAAQPQRDVDVAIIGGGLVGLTLACALGGSDLRVAVIEPQSRQPDEYWTRAKACCQPTESASALADARYDPRVSALTLASEQILRNLGAWPLIAELRVCPYQRMHVWDGEGTAAIDFSAAEMYQPHLGHIIENRVTLASLYRVLADHDNLELMTGCALQSLSEPRRAEHGEGCRRTLTLSDGSRLGARLVVAADGARSVTRRLAGLTISEWDYQHHAIVTTVTMEREHQFTAWQRFTEDGPLAMLPLADAGGNDNVISIVWSTSPDQARELMALDDTRFGNALAEAFEQRLGAVTACDQRFCFPLVQRHAPDYVDQGVALVGDAAHTIHPLAGQGVNLGFLDAATLAEELLLAMEKRVDFADRDWLRRYQRRRQGENLRMMGLMAGFRHLYGQVPPPLQWLRNLGMQQVNSLAPLKQFFAGRAMGLESGRPELARPREQRRQEIS